LSQIEKLSGRRVWDSRGNPTVEVDVVLTDGSIGRAIAPAGASRGQREAVDLRDMGTALQGKDVSNALVNINSKISDALVGMPTHDLAAIDAALLKLDPSPTKELLGGNATVATSLAVLHAAAASVKQPLWRFIADQYNTTPSLPLPEIQIFGGGAHAGRRVDIQDFMIMVPGAGSFDEVMEITNEVYFAAGSIMEKRGLKAGVADEGGWWPNFNSNEEALETLLQAIELAGEKPGERLVISLDVAASEFGSQGKYKLALEQREMDTSELIDLLGRWMDDYPIASIEDPLGEDDTNGMVEFTKRFGSRVQIIGDDYLVTNASIVEQAIADNACNAVLIKPNQVGTVSEAVNAFNLAKQSGWGTIVSARSGETEDVSISHLATGLGALQLKVGSFQRSERMVKWNECLRIHDELGHNAFSGGTSLRNTWWGEQSKRS
jgi:enolase